MTPRSLLLMGSLLMAAAVSAQTRILFDATKAETAGNADWVIDADLANLDWNPGAAIGSGGFYTASNPQRVPTPAQSGVTAATAETYWTGALSAWGVDCAKKGYIVETLPWNGQITFNNAGNAQDLSNYKVFVIDEPNIRFTASEKTAILQWVAAGGGLFIISDHDQSDRNGDGWDSPAIWNDLFTNNSIGNNPFGISFDLQNFSETSSNIIAAASDSIIHGSMGNVTQVKWSGGTSITISTAANASVKGVVYRVGGNGSTNVLTAYARYGSGKVVAIGDSSPADDGSGNPNTNLFNGYFQDAGGNHQRLLMNATIWLATAGTTTALNTPQLPKGWRISAAPGSIMLNCEGGPATAGMALYNVAGQRLATGILRTGVGSRLIADGLRPGFYWVSLSVGGHGSCTGIRVP